MSNRIVQRCSPLGCVVGQNVRRIREMKQMSQYFVAEEAGISQCYLSEVENGQKCPTFRTIKSLAQALNIPVKDLILKGNQALFDQREGQRKRKERKIEEKVNLIIGQLYKSIIGHGPQSIKTRIIENLVVVRIQNYSSPIIDSLLSTAKGKEIYFQLVELYFSLQKKELIARVESLVEDKVLNVYYDHIITGKELLVYIICKDNIKYKLPQYCYYSALPRV
ncbi:MAG: Na-translocating system protein MpsC family protein [Halanaerobium sp.]|nr:Na-translocating system protein MpsC family protein [Halanaerobium sp.]